MGTKRLDIYQQTKAVLQHIEHNLQTVGANRIHVVEVSSFLVNMNDFAGYNKAYASSLMLLQGKYQLHTQTWWWKSK